MSGIGGRRLTHEEAEREAVTKLARWLLQTRDIGIHDVVLRLEDFARAAYQRGVDATNGKRIEMQRESE